MIIAKGQGASPGTARGPLALSASKASDLAARGTPPVFVRNEMNAEDVPAIRVSAGVIIARGGITADGAVAARALDKPCIVGCASLIVTSDSIRSGDAIVLEGAPIVIDGATGEVSRA